MSATPPANDSAGNTTGSGGSTATGGPARAGRAGTRGAARWRRWLDGLLDSYVRTSGPPDLDAVRAGLWPGTDPRAWDETDEVYRAVVLEQYKLYVETADRVSSRRGYTNTFFLTLNTAFFALIGAFWQDPPDTDRSLLVVPWAVLVVQCLAWFWLLRSYRQLNTAKYAVIGVLEERLPASPYWRGEWSALGEGRDETRYWPMSHVEQWIPGLFAVAYTAGLVTVLLAGG